MGDNNIMNVGIIGSGTMGSGIAQLVSSSGIKVTLLDVNQQLLEKAKQAIGKNLKRSVDKGRMSGEEMDNVLSGITASTDYGSLRDADIVIEAVTEDLEVKKQVFSLIEENTAGEVIIATNTSTLPVIELAMITKRPEKVAGIHFFNPAPVMKLVEIVRTVKTSQETVDTARIFAESLGKDPVITRDRPGFIVNRILFPMINEAIFALEEGMGSAEEIDRAMKLGTNQPIGPLALADMVGLDVSLDVLNVLHSEFNDPKYRPAPLLRELVRAGYLGKKTGKGFYEY